MKENSKRPIEKIEEAHDMQAYITEVQAATKNNR